MSWVNDWTGDAGADVVFEVSGAAAAVFGSTDLVKVRGTVVIVAIHPQPRPINLQRGFWRELRLLGARVYERADFERAGFVFDGESDLLRNPQDDRSVNVFEPSIRGRTDRFVYRFRKPAR